MARIVTKGITTISIDIEELLVMLASNVEDYYIDVGTGTDFYISDRFNIKNVRVVEDEIELDIESD